MNRHDTCQSIIDGLDSMIIRPACENYSDIYQFFVNTSLLLHHTHQKNPESFYVEPVSTWGVVYTSIDKACKELIRVNAYQEAILIYQHFLDILEGLKDTIEEEEKDVLEDSYSAIQESLLDTLKLRDDYTSKRKEVLAKYSGIIKKIKE